MAQSLSARGKYQLSFPHLSFPSLYASPTPFSFNFSAFFFLEHTPPLFFLLQTSTHQNSPTKAFCKRRLATRSWNHKLANGPYSVRKWEIFNLRVLALNSVLRNFGDPKGWMSMFPLYDVLCDLKMP